MSMAYTVAVAGSGNVTTDLIDDTLTDTLRAYEQDVRLLVPASEHRLTAGVRAAVEWAWERDVQVVAVSDGEPGGEMLAAFLSDGADEVRERKIINEGIVGELAAAIPSAALFVIMADEEDAETTDLVRRCHEAEIPVFDLMRGGIELDPYNMDDPETSDHDDDENREEETMETNAPQTSADGGDWVLVDTIRAEELQQAAQVPAVSDVYLDALEAQAAELVQVSTRTAALIKEIRNGNAVTVKTTTKKTRLLVSLDYGKTWAPRGRGRLPARAMTRPAE